MNAASAVNPTHERRRERRVPLHLPMLIRGTDRMGETFEERTSSVNLARGGVAFVTRYAVNLGGRVEISIPVAPTAAQPDTEFSTQGRIVHLAPAPNNSQIIVGVEFTGPRFHRVFVSEQT